MTRVERWGFVVAAALAISVPSCTSSQIDMEPEHPAAPEATVAPLPPVGEALSTDDAPPAAPDGAPHDHHAAHSGATHGGAPASQDAKIPSGADDDETEQWTCPMHPEVVQSKPGKCPKCGMKLVPLAAKKAR